LQDIARLREFEQQAAEARNQGQSSRLGPTYFSDRLSASARDSLGPPLESASRQLDQFRSGIASAKSQLDSLPEPIRSHFIPAIQGAEREFVRLSALGPRATAEEIENAVRSMDVLTAATRRATQAASVQGFGDFIDQASVRQAVGELQALQRVLVQVEATAGGPAAQAYERYRQRLQAAITAGETGLPRVRQELVALQREAARAAAETGRISFGGAMRAINRGGDMARGGVDNFSLALNQAAFAIDDFFSATGGLEFKLRAVSNNITQLAFILGGTTGLFVGLAAVIGGQVAVAIARWATGGKTAEDQTKALNEALSQQKNTAEELAKAFESLGESLTRGVFSPAAREANEFRKQLSEIAKKQRELRDSDIALLDPAVQQERATQNTLQRRLESETNAGRRFLIQSEIDDSQLRERSAMAAARAAVTGGQASAAINRSGDALFSQRIRGEDTVTAQDVGFLDRARSRGAEAAAAKDQAALLDVLVKQRDEIVSSGLANSDIAVANSLAELESLIKRLRASLDLAAFDDLARSILEDARKASNALTQAQGDIAEAIKSGVPGARQLAALADDVGNSLQRALDALEKAAATQDPAEREKAVKKAQDDLDAARRREAEVTQRSDAARREQTLNPERQIDAVVSRTQSLIDGIGQPAAALQSRLRELEFQRGTVQRQLEAAPADPVLIQAEQQLNESIRALEKEVAELDETFNGFEGRERRRLLGDPERGRTLSMTPAERAAEQAQQGLNDILARFAEVAENTTGLIDKEGYNAAATRFLDDQMRQAAPLVYGMQDARQNALLQGPSKAALGAVDATTMEGQRELNRLLRGDDPAKDLNLMELRRQTELLRTIAEKAPPPVVN
jgi:hypothetical protein